MRHESAVELWNGLVQKCDGGRMMPTPFGLVAASHDAPLHMVSEEEVDFMVGMKFKRTAEACREERKTAAEFLREWADALEGKNSNGRQRREDRV